MALFFWRSTIFLTLIFAGGILAISNPVRGYKNQNELTNWLKAQSQRTPDLLHLESLGKTTNSHDLWLITLGKGDTEKPAIAIIGNIEADDVASSELCLKFIDSSIAAYGVVDSATALLDRFTFYIVPRVNPDATEQLWRKERYARLLNGRSLDLDHDGQINEDGFDDLDGNGYITQMRVSDPAGEWMADPENPQLMRKANPAKNETGTFKLFDEGLDNDNDGLWNEDPAGGVSFDQNFSFEYKPFVPGAGPHPVSEIESRAIADFLFEHQNICAVFSFSQNENLLHPWDAAKDGETASRKPITKVLPDDAKQYEFIAEQFNKVTGLKNAPQPTRGFGHFSTWAYFHYGRWSFAAPAWWPTAVDSDSSQKTKKDDPLAQDRILLNWLEINGVNGHIEWAAVNHPDFEDQQVEVGGFLPGVEKNPPADSLDGLAEKYSAFIYHLAAHLPRLGVTTKVEALDKQVYRVTAVVKNNGYLPTNSELGGKSQWVRKVKAELLLSDGQQIISGNTFYLMNAIPGHGTREQSWLVMGKKGSEVQIVVGSPSVGSVSKTISLK